MTREMEQIIIVQSPEIEAELVRAKINLVRELQNRGLEVERSDEAIEPELLEHGAKNKDVVLVILASTAAVAVLGETVRRILQAYLERPRMFEDEETKPVLDGKGKVLRNEVGRPYLQKVKVHKLLEVRRKRAKTTDTFQITKLLTLSLQNESDG